MALIPTAGTVISFSTDDGTTYKQIKKVQELPSFGAQGGFIDSSGIEDTIKTYQGGGVKDTPDFSISFKEVNTDADQIALLTAADADTTILVKIAFPGGGTYTITVATSGYTTDGTGDSVVHTVNGKQSGGVTEV